MPTKNTIQKIGCTLASQAPSSPPDADAERDARRRAEAGDERAFSIGQGEQEPGDAADQAPRRLGRSRTPMTIGAPMLMRESAPRRRSRCKIRATDCVPRIVKRSCLGPEPFGKAACGQAASFINEMDIWLPGPDFEPGQGDHSFRLHLRSYRARAIRHPEQRALSRAAFCDRPLPKHVYCEPKPSEEVGHHRANAPRIAELRGNEPLRNPCGPYGGPVIHAWGRP